MQSCEYYLYCDVVIYSTAIHAVLEYYCFGDFDRFRNGHWRIGYLVRHLVVVEVYR